MSKALREAKCFSRSTRCAGADEAAGAAAHRIELAGWPAPRAPHGLPQTGHSWEMHRAPHQPGASPAQSRGSAGSRRPRAARSTVSPIADVLAGDLVLVVQCGVGDDDAAHRHRLQPRHRRQGAGAANLNVDLLQHRRRLLGGELVRQAPARAARHEAQALLPVEPVHLVDDAVDVIAEVGALALRSGGNARAALPPNGTASSADWPEGPSGRRPRSRPSAFVPGSSGASPQA